MDDSFAEKIINAIIEVFEGFSRVPGVEVFADDGTLCVLSNIPHPLVNRVLQTRLVGEDAALKIQTALAPFRTKGHPVMWHVWPNSSPADLAEQLFASGLTHFYDAPAMIADLEDLPEEAQLPDGIRLERAVSDEMMKDYRIPLKAAFELPDEVIDFLADNFSWLGYGEDAAIRSYVAYDDGRPAACATVFLGADGVAGVWNVAAVPESRGKGLGTAVTWIGCHEAKQKGYRHAILMSSEMGYRIYQRLGFKAIFTSQVYLWQPPEDQSAGA